MAITTINSLAIPAGTVVSADLTYPLTGFSSTGIDDNATSTAITIDSSENVGIGTASPSSKLDIVHSNNNPLRLQNSTGVIVKCQLEDNATRQGEIALNTGEITFSNGTGSVTERMRIDDSGNVGIGTASPSFLIEAYGATNASTGWNAGGTVTGFAQANTSNGDFRFGTTTSHAVGFYISGTERMRIDSSGNVGIGTTDTGNAGLSVSKANGSNNVYARINGVATANEAGLQISDQNTLKWTMFKPGSSNDLAFYNHTGPSEAMRIDSSGNLLVGTTALNTGQIASTISVTGGQIKQQYRSFGTGNITVVEFVRDTGGTPTTPGSITCTSTATAYNTSSDQRLKENIVDAPAGNIDAIRVRSFDWKADGSHQTYGMVAQELVDVAPEAVSQGATEDDMWGVDYSKLVPMMIKEIQDLKAEVAALKGA